MILNKKNSVIEEVKIGFMSAYYIRYNVVTTRSLDAS